MMRFDVLTLFPEIFAGYLTQSLLKLAIDGGLVSIHAWDIRRWATGKHRSVDDRPFGGGPGMVIMPEPVYACVEDVQQRAPQPGQLILLNTITSNGGNTGGSIVVTEGNVGNPSPHYAVDRRPIAKVTLEELMERAHASTIDILKLDCEGSEFSILENTSVLDHVKLIVGEYHGLSRWERLRQSRFPDWIYHHLQGEELGLFHLINPAFL